MNDKLLPYINGLMEGMIILGKHTTYSTLRQAQYIPEDADPQDVEEFLNTIIEKKEHPHPQPPNWCYGSWLGNRTYIIDEKEYLSVSTVLKMAENFVNAHSFAFSNAALVGTYIHYRVQCQLATDAGLPLPTFEPTEPYPRDRMKRLHGAMKGWNDFYGMFSPDPICIEAFVYSQTGYAGRADLICTMDHSALEDFAILMKDQIRLKRPALRDDDIWLIDFKTGKFYPKYQDQLWAYKQAWNEHHPEFPVNRTALLFLNENGFEFREMVGQMNWDISLEKVRKMYESNPEESEEDFISRARSR